MMTEENNLSNTSAPPAFNPPVKRKRGRPRKDWSLTPKRSTQSTAIANPKVTMNNHPTEDANNGPMFDRLISGTVDSSFDAGYFISVRIGNSPTILRGVVFLPGRAPSISAANDIAPEVQMHHRKDHFVPPPNSQYQTNGIGHHEFEETSDQAIQMVNQQNLPHVMSTDFNQASRVPVIVNHQATPLGGITQQSVDTKVQSQPGTRLENLKFVEQDDIMQVFEVPVPSDQGPKANTDAVKIIPSESDQPNSLLVNQFIPLTSAIQNHGVEDRMVAKGKADDSDSEQHQSSVETKAIQSGSRYNESRLENSQLMDNGQLKYLSQEQDSTSVKSMPSEIIPVEAAGKTAEVIRDTQSPRLKLNQIPQEADHQPVPLIKTLEIPEIEVNGLCLELNQTPPASRVLSAPEMNRSLPLEPHHNQLVLNEVNSHIHQLQQNLGSSNSQLLPIVMMGESMDFTMERPMFPNSPIVANAGLDPQAKHRELSSTDVNLHNHVTRDSEAELNSRLASAEANSVNADPNHDCTSHGGT